MTSGCRQMSRRNYRLKPAKRSKSARFGSSAVSKPSRRGAAAVEFALVAPLIFLFLFAGIEFGRLLMTLHGLEAAAREGCRVAVSWDVTQQDVEQTVAERLAAFGISDYTLTIDPSPLSSVCQWEPINVRITVTYNEVSWLPAPGYLRGITLAGSCTLPQESDQCDS